MILAVVVPSYLPVSSYFGKILLADVIIWADSFQYKRHGSINRTPIKTANGTKWLTIPVRTKGLGKQSIRQILIDSRQNWNKIHWKSIELNYQNAPYFGLYADELEDMLKRKYQRLVDILYDSFDFAHSHLHSHKKILQSSQLPQIRDRTQRLLAWASATGCDCYLMHQEELPLIDAEQVSERGIKLLTFTEQVQEYHQQFEGFLAPVSILDLFMNEGMNSQTILRKQFKLQDMNI